MAGSPVAGKTLLASTLPEMFIEESLDMPRIYSVADHLPPETPILVTDPSARRIASSATPVWWAAATGRIPARSL